MDEYAMLDASAPYVPQRSATQAWGDSMGTTCIGLHEGWCQHGANGMRDGVTNIFANIITGRADHELTSSLLRYSRRGLQLVLYRKVPL